MPFSPWPKAHLASQPLPGSRPPPETHTTGTVTAHHRFVRGLFLHRGLVRCTWVMEMKTGEIVARVRPPTARGPVPGESPRPTPSCRAPLTSV